MSENHTLHPQVEAEYTLETEVGCPNCKESIQTLYVVRMLRTRVNFTSVLPRRGQVLVCPKCQTAISGEVSGMI